MSFHADPDRYESMTYRRCGRSGIRTARFSLGLWHNFGDDAAAGPRSARSCGGPSTSASRHFDLANNYGPPYGSAESNFGRILAQDFAPYRDELMISTKAGWDMWPGPYGEFGSRKYLLASLDQSLRRMGLDYVDIFYSHRFDPDTPLEETMGALDTAVRSGRALYAGISSYSPQRTREAAAILRELGTPLFIHQPSYSMLNRWIEDELLDTLDRGRRRLHRVLAAGPGHADRQVPRRRARRTPVMAQDSSLSRDLLIERQPGRIQALNDIAARRGQSLAQLALAWALRDERVTSVLIGASAASRSSRTTWRRWTGYASLGRRARRDRPATPIECGIDLWRGAAPPEPAADRGRPAAPLLSSPAVATGTIGGMSEANGGHGLSDDPRDWRRADFAVLRSLPTRWSDDDTYGHVNNVVHYLMFDTAVNGWLIEASGVDIRGLPAIGLVVETSCRYFAELRFPETVTAGLALERLGTISVVYRLALFGQGETPAAAGRFVHVYVDRESRRPVPVPPPIRAALDQLTASEADVQPEAGQLAGR